MLLLLSRNLPILPNVYRFTVINKVHMLTRIFTEIKLMFTCVISKVKSIFKKIASYLPIIIFTVVFLGIFLGIPCLLIRHAYRYNKRIYEHIMQMPTDVNQASVPYVDSSHVYIIQPSGEQEVIIIGDPERINVKPKKTSKSK